jgi:uncharacterized protein (TIGR04255 family)
MSEPPAQPPEFGQPPVVEVALSVQFKRLEHMRSAHLGLLWDKFRHQFPRTEDYGPLPPAYERFDQSPTQPQLGVEIRAYDVPPLPRAWFLNEGGTELIQIQPDRFMRNWRKVGESDQYVRYAHIQEKFAAGLGDFERFIGQERLGEFTPNQCEVTYVNHIISGEGWASHGELGKILCAWSGRNSDAFLPTPEGIGISVYWVIPYEGQAVGRLHMALQPAYRVVDGKPMYILNLTARGSPIGADVAGALKFLDIGHEWIVRGFASMTTKEMHRVWRRTDVS